MLAKLDACAALAHRMLVAAQVLFWLCANQPAFRGQRPSRPRRPVPVPPLPCRWMGPETQLRRVPLPGGGGRRRWVATSRGGARALVGCHVVRARTALAARHRSLPPLPPSLLTRLCSIHGSARAHTHVSWTDELALRLPRSTLSRPRAQVQLTLTDVTGGKLLATATRQLASLIGQSIEPTRWQSLDEDWHWQPLPSADEAGAAAASSDAYDGGAEDSAGCVPVGALPCCARVLGTALRLACHACCACAAHNRPSRV